jgi:hypothetical protein
MDFVFLGVVPGAGVLFLLIGAGLRYNYKYQKHFRVGMIVFFPFIICTYLKLLLNLILI